MSPFVLVSCQNDPIDPPPAQPFGKGILLAAAITVEAKARSRTPAALLPTCTDFGYKKVHKCY